MKKNMFYLSTFIFISPSVLSSDCLSIEEFITKNHLTSNDIVESSSQLKDLILKKYPIEKREYYSKFLDDSNPIFKTEFKLSEKDILWIDNFLSSSYLKNFSSIINNNNISILDNLPYFESKYNFAKLMSRDHKLDFKQINIVIKKNNVDSYFESTTPNNKIYEYNSVSYIYIQKDNTLIVKAKNNKSNEIYFEPISFEKNNIGGYLDTAYCGIKSNVSYAEKSFNQYQLYDIDYIINKIKEDYTIKNYIENPSGMCFSSAHRIGEILSELGISKENITYRLTHLTRPGIDWKTVNIDLNDNHMVIMLTYNNSKYIFDPTIIQFHNINYPFYGTEKSWIQTLEPVWNGRVQKKAIQYLDYPDYMSADNASIKYRMDFDAMTRDGGIFIHKPQWYIDFYIRENSPPPKKSKIPKFLVCLKPNIKE